MFEMFQRFALGFRFEIYDLAALKIQNCYFLLKNTDLWFFKVATYDVGSDFQMQNSCISWGNIPILSICVIVGQSNFVKVDAGQSRRRLFVNKCFRPGNMNNSQKTIGGNYSSFNQPRSWRKRREACNFQIRKLALILFVCSRPLCRTSVLVSQMGPNLDAPKLPRRLPQSEDHFQTWSCRGLIG